MDPSASKDRNTPCSNLYPTKLVVAGNTYHHSEGAYGSTKATDMALVATHPLEQRHYLNMANRIQHIEDPYEAMKLQQTIDTSTNKQWQQRKYYYMQDILECKAEQCPEYRNFLLNSANIPLKENTSNRFWGANGGRNMLGKLHGYIRRQLQKQQH